MRVAPTGHRPSTLWLWWTVFLKELRDVLRDRRTLHFMFTVPLVFYPLLTVGVGAWQAREMRKAAGETLSVAVEPPHEGETLRSFLFANGVAVRLPEEASIVMTVEPGFDQAVSGQGTGKIALDGVNPITLAKAETMLARFGQQQVACRLEAAGVSASLVRAVEVTPSAKGANLTPNGKKSSLTRALTAGLCAYFLIFLTFTGSLAPAVDLGAGEKERGTLETLLASPVPRWAILVGKLGVIMFCGLLSAALALVGQVVATTLTGQGEAWMLSEIAVLAEPWLILQVLLIMLPFSAMTASIMLTFSLRARSAREAQQRLSPLLMLVTFLGLAGVSSVIPLNAITACIPVLNASLSLSHIMLGDIDLTYMLTTIGSLLLLAWLLILWGASHLCREKVLFRQ